MGSKALTISIDRQKTKDGITFAVYSTSVPTTICQYIPHGCLAQSGRAWSFLSPSAYNARSLQFQAYGQLHAKLAIYFGANYLYQSDSAYGLSLY